MISYLLETGNMKGPDDIAIGGDPNDPEQAIGAPPITGSKDLAAISDALDVCKVGDWSAIQRFNEDLFKYNEFQLEWATHKLTGLASLTYISDKHINI
jgi:hypothetical protein